jgi:phospholipase C
MYDENDGFFDHAPPPAAPSRDKDGTVHGGSTVDTTGEYHLVTTPSEEKAERPELMGRPYGLGARVPMTIISPWSRGGWVNSQVFDHTSVIRFLEQRFGVMEPNISPWRRAVCGDLTSAFNFKTPNAAPPPILPQTTALAARAAALPGRTRPVTPATPEAPVQPLGPRLSRALPYRLAVSEELHGGEAGRKTLTFANLATDGPAAVFQVYDRHHLDRAPRRYTVSPGKSLEGVWDGEAYDLWVLGPHNFHRHFVGRAGTADATVTMAFEAGAPVLRMVVWNRGGTARRISVTPNPYDNMLKPGSATLAPNGRAQQTWPLAASRGWYDLSVRLEGEGGWLRRYAGRLETGADSMTDPAAGGPSLMDQVKV